MDLELLPTTIHTFLPDGKRHPKKPNIFLTKNTHKDFEEMVEPTTMYHSNTLTVLFHPNGLNLKLLPAFHEEAKMSLLSTVYHSSDPINHKHNGCRKITLIFLPLPPSKTGLLQERIV